MQRFDDERETAAHKVGGRRFDISDLELPPLTAAGERGGGGDEGEERETRWSQRVQPGVDAAVEGPAAGEERETKFHGEAPAPLDSVAWFYCLKGLRQGQFHQFKKRRTEFGRAADADFLVEDDYASGHHGAILFDDGAWKICDFASSNGTVVNGKRLGNETQNPLELQDGDRVVIGETELVFKRI